MDKITSDRIEAELLSCIAICINDWNYGTKTILLNGINNIVLVEFLAQFRNLTIYYLNSQVNLSLPNVRCYKKALDLPINQFDVIIDLDNKSTEAYSVLLKQSGILIINLAHLELHIESAKNTIEQALFNIKMPFHINNKYYLFLSHRFHPLADISLQKIDMIDGLMYYNAKIGEAAFALPAYLKNALKGIVRN